MNSQVLVLPPWSMLKKKKRLKKEKGKEKSSSKVNTQQLSYFHNRLQNSYGIVIYHFHCTILKESNGNVGISVLKKETASRYLKSLLSFEFQFPEIYVWFLRTSETRTRTGTHSSIQLAKPQHAASLSQP